MLHQIVLGQRVKEANSVLDVDHYIAKAFFTVKEATRAKKSPLDAAPAKESWNARRDRPTESARPQIMALWILLDPRP